MKGIKDIIESLKDNSFARLQEFLTSTILSDDNFSEFSKDVGDYIKVKVKDLGDYPGKFRVVISGDGGVWVTNRRINPNNTWTQYTYSTITHSWGSNGNRSKPPVKAVDPAFVCINPQDSTTRTIKLDINSITQWWKSFNTMVIEPLKKVMAKVGYKGTVGGYLLWSVPSDIPGNTLEKQALKAVVNYCIYLYHKMSGEKSPTDALSDDWSVVIRDVNLFDARKGLKRIQRNSPHEVFDALNQFINLIEQLRAK